MIQISVKTFTEANLESFLKMSELEYGLTISTNFDHIRWKYLGSPFGGSYYVILLENDEVVGRVLAQPRTLCVASKVLKAALITDLLINQEHRSPVNFINITKACSNIASFDLVYHTSNERTFSLYSKLLRFPNPFSLRGYGFPVRLAGFFTSIIGLRIDVIDWLTAPLRWLLEVIACVVNFIAKLNIVQRGISDDELGTICIKCLRKSGPHFVRTNAFLKWRFGDAPLWPATVYRIDRKGKFLGYVVTRKIKLGCLNYLVLMDFILDPDTPLIVQIALRLWLIRKTITSKVDAFFTMVNPSSAIARKCVGFPFASIPNRLLPHATPIFVRACSSDNKEFETTRSIHLTLADLDYF